MLQYAGILLLISAAGGVIPLVVKWNERLLHAVLALATGIFLGAVFLEMLPAFAEMTRAQHAGPIAEVLEHGHGHGHAHPGSWLWFFVLVGVVGVYLAEALVFRGHDLTEQQEHRAVGYAAMFGLSVHSFLSGIGMASSSGDPALEQAFFLSLVAHKGAEAFSLSTVFQLAQFTRARIAALMALFITVAPAGILLGQLIVRNLGESSRAIMMALAAGTFLYVCLCELLPEVFHHREDGVLKIAFLSGGVALMFVIEAAA
jgi:zinc transporter ZupT